MWALLEESGEKSGVLSMGLHSSQRRSCKGRGLQQRAGAGLTNRQNSLQYRKMLLMQARDRDPAASVCMIFVHARCVLLVGLKANKAVWIGLQGSREPLGDPFSCFATFYFASGLLPARSLASDATCCNA